MPHAGTLTKAQIIGIMIKINKKKSRINSLKISSKERTKFK